MLYLSTSSRLVVLIFVAVFFLAHKKSVPLGLSDEGL
jgi:hypothetical protein